jgi:hypothetical protein
MEEIRRFDQSAGPLGAAPHDIYWLKAGDVFEF